MPSTSPFLVVGASQGLGRATARRLDHVVVAGRNAEADVRVDLRDLADVARAAGELRARGPFAGIICNAGIQSFGELRRTGDGFEETFAVNHLAHLALLAHLAPPPGTRVAFIGSGTLDPDNRGARRFGFRGAQWATVRELAAGVDEHSARDRYATSKLCNLLTAQALARRGLCAFSFDPGLMLGTGLAREYPLILRILASTVLRVVALALPGTSSTRRSGAALAALMHTAEPGYYDFHRRRVAFPAIAQHDDWSEDLYATSLALAGIARDPFAPGYGATRTGGSAVPASSE